MNQFRRHSERLVARVIFFALILSMLPNISGAELRPPGFRPEQHGVHALVGARIVTQPGKMIKTGTVVIRDGLIEAVGAKVKAPKDARIWDLAGATIYAGMIDPYVITESGKPPVDSSGFQPIRAGSVVDFYGAENHSKAKRPDGPGYDIHGITPQRRMDADLKPDKELFESLRASGFTTANLVPAEGILRGESALVNLGNGDANEILLRSRVFQHAAFERMDDVYPASLMGVIAALRQTFLDAEHYRADRAHYENNRATRKRPDANVALDALQGLIEGQRLVFEPGSSLMVEQAVLLARKFKFQTAIVASGEEWRRPEIALAAGVPFIVPVGFSEAPKLPTEDDWMQVSLDQLRSWDWAAENPAQLRKLGLTVSLTTHALGDRKSFRKQLQLARRRGLSERDALAGLTTVPADLLGVGDVLGTIAKGRIANLTIVQGDYFKPEDKLREVWIDGVRHEVNPTKNSETKKGKGDESKASKTKKEKDKDTKKKVSDLLALRVARHPSLDRGPLAQPSAVLVRNATVWTSGPDGNLTNASLFVLDGLIRALGTEADRQAKAARKVHEIDGTGLHVTAGLIDCHSHTAILGGANEGTLPSSAMVGVRDVVNSETENFLQQLAGGLTTVNLLHGSANPIGGRNAVIKLRFGEPPSELLFKEAPFGIKFALGENVKQSNWGDDKTTRFPQTRMGVVSFHLNRFTAAKQYLARRKRFEENGGPPVRRNLELDVLGEIIEGKRWIHCHSYRQDEIIALMRTMESFGVQIGTFQHVLEGYKIADEIAAHGAGGSAFSDWWGYKFEVYDAIPYAGALMWQRGVNVSFNSDSSELARRMNMEAAKAVKYGGVPEQEALKFVTINPARQLKIDQWVGSLEEGKHADFAIWSGSPLDSRSLCLQTWVDGEKYFDREEASKRAERRRNERTNLIGKAKKFSELSGGSGGDDKKSESARAAFFIRLWEHSNDMTVERCLDCKSKGGAQ
jgi:imidazolonepropionase-like amidohydrolase